MTIHYYLIKMKISNTIFGLLCIASVNAQNLVPNPGFETYSNAFCGIPAPGDFTNTINDWSSPTTSSPDMYLTIIDQACFNFQPNSTYGGPIGLKGTQDPHDGRVFAGIFTHTIANMEQRDYIQAQLTSPMVAGNRYVIEYYVSLADNHEFSSDGVDAHLSTTAISQSGGQVMSFAPQITSGAISETQDWVRVFDTIVAQEAFTHITIGNFASDASTTLTSNTSASGEPGTYGSYYFIDDVRVEEIQNDPPASLTETFFAKLEIFPNPFENQLTIRPGDHSSQYDLSITDAFGKVIIEQSSLIGKHTISTNDFARGIYFVSLRSEGQYITQKIIK